MNTRLFLGTFGSFFIGVVMIAVCIILARTGHLGWVALPVIAAVAAVIVGTVFFVKMRTRS